MADAPAPWPVAALRPADAPAYKRLRDEMLLAFPDAFTSDAATERARPAESYAPRLAAEAPAFTLGMRDGDRLVAALSCEGQPRRRERHVGHLAAMMVHPGWQRRGLGRQLLAAAIARARADGRLLQLALSVSDGNDAAIALYAEAGFVPYGCLPRAVRRDDGSFLDKRLMVLRLDDPPA